jgi:hypothetical protein
MIDVMHLLGLTVYAEAVGSVMVFILWAFSMWLATKLILWIIDWGLN